MQGAASREVEAAAQRAQTAEAGLAAARAEARAALAQAESLAAQLATTGDALKVFEGQPPHPYT